MNKHQFNRIQQDLFGGLPSHSELVKRGIQRVRAHGLPWGRPRKINMSPLERPYVNSRAPYAPESALNIVRTSK